MQEPLRQRRTKRLRGCSAMALAGAKKEFNALFSVSGTNLKRGFHIIAGPCSVESAEQIQAAAAHLAGLGVRILRGGAFKPRTSPHSFQGLAEEGLQLLAQAAAQYDMLSISEVMDTETVV